MSERELTQLGGTLDLVECDICHALVPDPRIADHERWHEQEAERVEAAILARQRREGR